jgi:hypothetical protein
MTTTQIDKASSLDPSFTAGVSRYWKALFLDGSPMPPSTPRSSGRAAALAMTRS